MTQEFLLKEMSASYKQKQKLMNKIKQLEADVQSLEKKNGHLQKETGQLKKREKNNLQSQGHDLGHGDSSTSDAANILSTEISNRSIVEIESGKTNHNVFMLKNQGAISSDKNCTPTSPQGSHFINHSTVSSPSGLSLDGSKTLDVSVSSVANSKPVSMGGKKTKKIIICQTSDKQLLTGTLPNGVTAIPLKIPIRKGLEGAMRPSIPVSIPLNLPLTQERDDSDKDKGETILSPTSEKERKTAELDRSKFIQSFKCVDDNCDSTSHQAIQVVTASGDATNSQLNKNITANSVELSQLKSKMSEHLSEHNYGSRAPLSAQSRNDVLKSIKAQVSMHSMVSTEALSILSMAATASSDSLQKDGYRVMTPASDKFSNLSRLVSTNVVPNSDTVNASVGMDLKRKQLDSGDASAKKIILSLAGANKMSAVQSKLPAASVAVVPSSHLRLTASSNGSCMAKSGGGKRRIVV